MVSKSVYFSTAIVLSFFASNGVSAQQAPEDVTADSASDGSDRGDIIVTAQRRNERLIDVPISVSSVSGETLTNAGIRDISQIKLAVPGSTVRVSGGYTQPYIRGIGSSAKTPLNEAPVATYVDDVYIASESNVTSFTNIASVEVLKGPQGTLFGRNATGGLFNIKTLDPSFTPTGNFHVGYGNYQAVSGDGYFATGLSDKLAADISFYASHQGKGFGKNLFVPGENGKNYYNAGVRSKWLLEADDATRAVLILDYSAQKNNLGVGHTIIPGSDISAGVPAPVFSENPYDNIDDFRPLVKAKTGGVSLNVSHEFDAGFALKSITAYRVTHLGLDLDVDGTPTHILNAQQRIKDSTFSQELQAQSTGSGPLSWTAGLFYFNYQATQDPPQKLFFSSSTTIQDQTWTADSVAAYVQGGYALADDTHLTLGARYTWEDREIKGAIFTQTDTGTTVVAGPGASQQKNVDNVSFRASLDHKFTPDLMVYASFNSGFKSGGFSNVNIPGYDSEKIYAYEVGLKSQLFDRRMTFNLAGFYYDYKDVQVQVITGTAAGTIVQNGAGAEIYGIDADMNLKLGDALTLNGSFEWLHAQYSDFQNAPIATLPNGGGSLQPADATGNYLPYAPKYSGNLGVTHKVPLGPGTLTSNVLAYFSGRYYAQPDNFQSQKPYVSLNASATWESDSGYSIKLWANNLTDKLIMQNAFDTKAFIISYDPPRTYGVTLGVSF